MYQYYRLHDIACIKPFCSLLVYWLLIYINYLLIIYHVYNSNIKKEFIMLIKYQA